MGELSKAAVDRLGERLRATGESDPEAVAALADYRAGFTGTLIEVREDLQRQLSFQLIGDSARLKTLESTVAKLQSQPGRLSRMQNVAGCRLVVPSLFVQDRAVADSVETLRTTHGRYFTEKDLGADIGAEFAAIA